MPKDSFESFMSRQVPKCCPNFENISRWDDVFLIQQVFCHRRKLRIINDRHQPATWGPGEKHECSIHTQLSPTTRTLRFSKKYRKHRCEGLKGTRANSRPKATQKHNRRKENEKKKKVSKFCQIAQEKSLKKLENLINTIGGVMTRRKTTSYSDYLIIIVWLKGTKKLQGRLTHKTAVA